MDPGWQELLTVIVTSLTVVALVHARTSAAVRTRRVRARAHCEIVRSLGPGSRLTDVNGETVIVEVATSTAVKQESR
jgi:hypothetical protein